MSIRLRLTLLYSAILALTLVVAGTALYVAFGQLTMDVSQDALADEAKQLLDSKDFKLDKLEPPRGRLTTTRTFVQTRDTRGRVVDSSESLDGFVLPLSEAEIDRALRGDVFTTTADTNAGRIRIYTKRVTDRNEPIGILQVAQFIANEDESLQFLRRTLLIGIPLVTLIAFGIGWLLAGAALGPINRITRTARTIGADRDFSRRVPYTGPQDELGRLATTLNRMLSELEAAFSQEERALRAQRRFSADVSHELRTPMTTIRGNIELLLREPPISDDDSVGVISDTLAESDRLIRLTNDLLLLERADADWTLPIEPVAVRPLIEDIVRQLQRVDPDRPLNIDGVSNVTVMGNRDALQQVLLILLDNAAKYSPPNSPIVLTASSDHDRVTLNVIDRGRGIPSDRLSHIFDRFYRADSARSGDGIGLGLAIAHALITAQLGEIRAESSVDAGSTFTIELPVAVSR